MIAFRWALYTALWPGRGKKCVPKTVCGGTLMTIQYLRSVIFRHVTDNIIPAQARDRLSLC